MKHASLAQMPAIGLMSGTSLDGIDGVLVSFHQDHMRALASATLAIPGPLRQELLALNQVGPDELRRAALAGNHLARLYAQIVHTLLETAGLAAAEVGVIGCHGQTVRHQPQEGYTLQLVNAALLAELTGITTVADFRSRDVAAGGEGAPLVPAFHQAAFSDPAIPRAVVNIGGFANITLLAPGQAPQGCDCGPGNALLDGWMWKHRGELFDRNGQWAASGVLLEDLLDEFLAHPFFRRPPPRSTGREEFNLDWVQSRKGIAGREPEDVQRTLLELTATAVAMAVRDQVPAVREVYLCGGGARNRMLFKRIARLLQPLPVATTRDLGMPEDQVEAFAFAWLARQALLGRPGNVPGVTGAAGARVLGAIYAA
ncbi:MAG: anhydro-N-acetylmuramic acid kinase [Pseudomonadota bacterium]|nr:anhydro-N-acetylmuramic acid kinase [Pseudomonadota bacterium]